MNKKVFINLATADLERAKAFFTGLGLRLIPEFSDDTAACLAISGDIYAMVLTTARFGGFIPGKEVADAARASETLTSLSFENRAAVDVFVDRALATGARVLRPPEDYGFMYGRSFQDPDGHVWEGFWMDPAKVPA